MTSTATKDNAKSGRMFLTQRVLVLVLVLLLLGMALLRSPPPKTAPLLRTNELQVAASVESPNSSDSSLALAEFQSFGFFTDIPEHHWRLQQKRTLATQPNMKCGENCSGAADAPTWFQENFEPEFSCLHERRIGLLGDGGKWVCDPHRLSQPNTPCLVYSVGSNGDFSFEQEVSKRIGPHCEIHTFDFGNYAHIAKRANIPNHQYHQWGISDQDSAQTKMKTLKTTFQELGHVGKKIDIFKIDCEGCEMTTFESWFDQGAILQQILVEVHSNIPRKIDLVKTPNFFKTMYKQGYVMFHKEPNIQFWCDPRIVAVEFAFFKLHPDYFLPPAAS